MILLLMGPPGSGKGTQSKLISERFGLYHLTTGGMLREEIKNRTATGELVEPLLKLGQFAPDHVVQQLVRDRVAKTGGKVLLDGYPRTEVQVEDLDEILGDRGESIDAILFLDVPEAVLRQRLAKRAEEEGRPDDSDAVFPKRWEEYTTKTNPAIDCYRGKPNFFIVDGNQTKEEVFAEICEDLERAVVKQTRGL